MQGPIWLLCAVLIRACVRTYGTAAQPDVLNDAQLNLQITLVRRFGPVHTRPTLQSSPVEFSDVMVSVLQMLLPLQ